MFFFLLIKYYTIEGLFSPCCVAYLPNNSSLQPCNTQSGVAGFIGAEEIRNRILTPHLLPLAILVAWILDREQKKEKHGPCSLLRSPPSHDIEEEERAGMLLLCFLPASYISLEAAQALERKGGQACSSSARLICHSRLCRLLRRGADRSLGASRQFLLALARRRRRFVEPYISAFMVLVLSFVFVVFMNKWVKIWSTNFLMVNHTSCDILTVLTTAANAGQKYHCALHTPLWTTTMPAWHAIIEYFLKSNN